MNFLIRQCGVMIDVSPDGVSPLPPAIVELLARQLCYEHKQFVRGTRAYDNVTGRHQRVLIESRNMFRMEEGRLVTCYGFIPRIYQLLTRAGHQVSHVDVSPPPPRPNCFTQDWDAVQREFTFRPKQLECLQAVAAAPGGVINAVTGFGKTVIMRALATLYPRAKIAIVVNGIDIAYGIVRHFTRQFPNIGMVGDQHNHIGRITVYSAGSLHRCDGDVDFVLADEAHTLMAPTYSEAMAAVFTRTRNYAFSATPDCRLDGAHAKMEMFFGPEVFRLLYPEALSLGLVAPIKVRWLPIMLEDNPAAGKNDTAKLRWGIWRNEVRNRLIAQDVLRQPPDTQIMISVATLEHAIHLRQYLPDFALAYAGIKDEELNGYKRSRMLPPDFQSMTTQMRETMRTGFENGELKRVIATDVWSTGVDFEKLQVLYRADARESQTIDTQLPGRTSRISADKTYAEIVDCIDCFDETFKRKSQSRRKHYAQHGWEQDWPLNRRGVAGVI